MTRRAQQCYSALFGVAVADAIGGPVEFTRREVLKENRVISPFALRKHFVLDMILIKLEPFL